MELELLAPLNRVNLLAGQNNTGKSNVLRFAQTVLGACRGPRSNVSIPPLAELDQPKVGAPGALEFAIALHIGREEIKALGEQAGSTLTEQTTSGVQEVLDSPALRLTDDDLVWFRFSLERGERGKSKVVHSQHQLDDVMKGLENSHLRRRLAEASGALTGRSGGRQGEDLGRVLASFNPLGFVPKVETIEAFRQVRSGEEGHTHLYNGVGLIEALARLEKPHVTQLTDREQFLAIDRFVRTVLDDPTVRIEIPHHRETIHVQRDGYVLPLENLGTGVHQVVILAAAATLLTHHLVCMEEPEIHLHPLLQRKLLRYLATETSNQYLVATHSAHMLDSEISSIFHVTLAGGETHVRFAAQPKDQAAICADLGYRPSDLVQANAVIWVEGPSDRIYLRHWLGLLDSELVEGIHYSLMFYGGRLLNHLSANDPDVDDFISLRRLNRHIAVVLDSDKDKQQARINETKKRILYRIQ